MMFFKCRPSSALGLEQPDDAADARAPKLEKVVEGAGAGNVPIAEAEPENAERPPESFVGKLS
jgi:hypothetical protein